jgi:hypothetical protein
VNVCPAIVIVPERASPGLAAAVYETVPLPFPLAVTELSQPALDVAVHGHADELMVNATLLEPPAAVAFALELPSDAVQPEA